jgi:hypothetical protein
MGYIYWIASYPKSGNTWMRAFLTALVTGAESDDLNLLQEIAPDENSGRYFQPYMSTPIEKASLVELASARPKAHRAMAAAADNFLFLKTHSLLGVHLGTPTITTDVTAGAIYIIRNPLDVAISYAAFRNRSVDETIPLMNQSGRVLTRPMYGSYEVAGSWTEHVETWTHKPHQRLLAVRYEDMLDDPQASFRRVTSFLQMRVDDELMAKAIERTSFSSLKAAEEKGDFKERPKGTERFFRSGKHGQWREALTGEQISKIVRACERPMKRFGYWEPDFDSLVHSQRTGTGA